MLVPPLHSEPKPFTSILHEMFLVEQLGKVISMSHTEVSHSFSNLSTCTDPADVSRSEGTGALSCV